MYGLLTKREVKMAEYWPRSFFCVFYMDLDFISVRAPVSVHNAQKELGQYRAILTPHLVTNPYISLYTSSKWPIRPEHIPVFAT